MVLRHSLRAAALCLGVLLSSVILSSLFVPSIPLLGVRPALAQSSANLVTFPSAPLAIRSGEGRVHRFKVEMARSPEERAQGLMFRPALAPDAGMLFDFGRIEPVAMWMKNTLIPLDMLFIGTDGAVVNIAQRTVPGSLTPIPSAKPVRFVLELPGGTAARLKLKPGDTVIHPLIGTGEP